MSLTRKSESGRILKEESVQKEFCQEAMRSLGEPPADLERVGEIQSVTPRSLRKAKSSQSISKGSAQRAQPSDIEEER